MPISNLNDKRGFTLVELMSAVVIAMIGLLGLAQAMNYAVQENYRTQQRDEAVQIAEEWMTDFRSRPFTSTFSVISTCSSCPGGRYDYGPQIVKSRIRGGGGSYVVLRSTTVNATDDHTDLGVRVRWKFKNVSTSHEVHSIRYRE